MVSIRKFINENVIQKNEILRREILRYNRNYGRIDNDFKRALNVIKIYIEYVVLKQKWIEKKQKKMEKLNYPESLDNQERFIENYENKLKHADKVVFDLEGVLVYFTINREFVETILKKTINLLEINEEFKGELQKERKKLIREIYLDFSIDNKTMHKLFDKTSQMGKKIYIHNNTQLDNEIFQDIIQKYFYSFTDSIDDKEEKNILHITNMKKNENDIVYENVNYIGEKYRPYYDKNIVTSIYCQIVNLTMHSGGEKYPLFYEYGFNYGGILTCGFCQYLENMAKAKNVDKFIFVARDGDIIHKVYKQFFNRVESEYVMFSRFASYELLFHDYPEIYIDKNIKVRIYRQECDNSIGKILKECGLEILYPYLTEENLKKENILTEENYLPLKKIILHHKKKVEELFNNSCMAAKKYFLDKVKSCKNVCVVDLGWNGTSIIYLKYLLEKKYGWEGTVTGAMIGASENVVTQNYIRMGVIDTYAFDNEFWRRTGTSNGEQMGCEETICIEALYSSEKSTLLRYKLTEAGEIEFIFGKENLNKEKIKEIHKGINEFAELFMSNINKYDLKILPRDAYLPLDSNMKNIIYRKKVFESYYEEVNAINSF